MKRLSRLAGNLVDRVLDLPTEATPYTVERDVAVPMPDGVTLIGEHYRPESAAGPLPVVLTRSPYGRAGLTGAVFAAPYARRGFQVFVQSTRGTFGSGGQFRPFTTEREDGIATVNWLREQPWCDGRIATVGASYLGHTQWAIAPYVDPPLECVALNITAARVTSAFYEQKTPGILNALNWTALIGRQERGAGPLVPNPRILAKLRRALRAAPLQAADVAVTGAPVAFWRDFVDHAGADDPFWSVADHDGADLTTLPPVSMVSGWWDLFLAGQLRDFTAIRAAGVEARIVVGPWRHGEPDEVRSIVRQDIDWLDHHLNGAPLPPQSRVHLNLQPTDTWLDFDEWPPKEATARPYHLRLAGRTGPRARTGRDAPGRVRLRPGRPDPDGRRSAPAAARQTGRQREGRGAR